MGLTERARGGDGWVGSGVGRVGLCGFGEVLYCVLEI